MIKPPTFTRPVWAEIDHQNLKSNFLKIKSELSPNTGILAVVKADAYGHGLIAVSRTLSRLGVKFLGVTSIEESLALQSAGIQIPSLILANIFPFSNLEIAIRKGIRVSVASVESALECEATARRLKKKVYVHAKIDSGMGRIGVNAKNALAFIEKICSLSWIKLEGIYTHLSSAYENPACTQIQIGIFIRLMNNLSARGVQIPYVHNANSGGIFLYPQAHFSLVRPGISLYGVWPVPFERDLGLKPVLSWKSRVIYLKRVSAGTPLSYGGTFKTQRSSVIATAAFGYADGFRRAFSNKAQVLVGGKRVSVVGRVTMDMTLLDVTDIPGVRVGDEVVMLGAQGEAVLPVEDLARWADTSPYEIFCGIAPRVPRVNARL